MCVCTKTVALDKIVYMKVVYGDKSVFVRQQRQKSSLAMGAQPSPHFENEWK